MEKTVRNILFDYSLVSSLPHAKHLTSENNKTILFIDSTGSTGFIDSTGSTGFIDSTQDLHSTLIEGSKTLQDLQDLQDL